MTIVTGAGLSLAPILDINAAARLRNALIDVRGRAAVIDGSRVQRLGGLCLQILLSARRTWAQDGLPLSIGPVSQALAEQLAAFGAADLQNLVEGDPQ